MTTTAAKRKVARLLKSHGLSGRMSGRKHLFPLHNGATVSVLVHGHKWSPKLEEIRTALPDVLILFTEAS